MATNVVNQVSYLRTSREFPEDLHQLSVEVDKAYIDTANAVNSRTISIFPVNRPAVNGESWFISGNEKQQGLRKVFTFTSTASITHNIQVNDPTQFVRAFGTYTDGTNSYGLIYGTTVAIAGVITFYVTSTQIIFNVGAAAPALTNGILVLEWISRP